jgi:hypothetical protein
MFLKSILCLHVCQCWFAFNPCLVHPNVFYYLLYLPKTQYVTLDTSTWRFGKTQYVTLDTSTCCFGKTQYATLKIYKHMSSCFYFQKTNNGYSWLITGFVYKYIYTLCENYVFLIHCMFFVKLTLWQRVLSNLVFVILTSFSIQNLKISLSMVLPKLNCSSIPSISAF